MKSLLSTRVALAALLALSSSACRGDEANIKLKLTRGMGGKPLANAVVVVFVENPPGGALVRVTDAQGLLDVPASYRNLRVTVGTDCDEQNACKHISAPSKLDGDTTVVSL